MCGIAGAAFLEGDVGAVVDAMAGGLRHRGPDDEGRMVDPTAGVAFGHRRLSILDLSSAGRQPMATVDGRYHIVYNGEVYNFTALRAELEGEGCAFRTGTDTEVVLAAYGRWREGCLPRLRGMFAFAIWDARDHELFLARDRLGIKPLYVASAGGGTVFASEVTALLRSERVARVADPMTLWEYLTHGAVHQPRTILRDVRALLPGHWMRVRRDGSETVRWWDLEAATGSLRAELAGIGYDDAVSRVRSAVDEATDYHLVSDVPVGAFLSGGIDSSAVVGLMARRRAEPVRTFSVGFGDDFAPMSELAWARVAAETFGTDHHEVVVTSSDAAAAFPGIVAALDQPSHDGANTYLVSRAAGESVKVALSGLGGDEVFAGYPHFARYARAARWAPHGLGRAADPLQRLASALPPRIGNEMRLLAADRPGRLDQARRLLDEPGRRAAASRALAREADALPRAQRAIPLGLDAVQEVSYAEVDGYLRDTLLRDADAMSMAHSLEVRPVLLDHPLVELGFALPARTKLAAGRTKAVLVDALADVLPRELIDRRKMGFEMPLASWLCTTLRPTARELLASARAERLFSPAYLREADRALEGAARVPVGLWANLVLVAWLERHRIDHP